MNLLSYTQDLSKCTLAHHYLCVQAQIVELIIAGAVYDLINRIYYGFLIVINVIELFMCRNIYFTIPLEQRITAMLFSDECLSWRVKRDDMCILLFQHALLQHSLSSYLIPLQRRQYLFVVLQNFFPPFLSFPFLGHVLKQVTREANTYFGVEFIVMVDNQIFMIFFFVTKNGQTIKSHHGTTTRINHYFQSK